MFNEIKALKSIIKSLLRIDLVKIKIVKEKGIDEELELNEL
ncbi:MAG: hypothetical protein QW589_02670 [Candidatus Bathyarchaeia archaeon]